MSERGGSSRALWRVILLLAEFWDDETERATEIPEQTGLTSSPSSTPQCPGAAPARAQRDAGRQAGRHGLRSAPGHVRNSRPARSVQRLAVTTVPFSRPPAPPTPSRALELPVPILDHHRLPSPPHARLLHPSRPGAAVQPQLRGADGRLRETRGASERASDRKCGEKERREIGCGR